MFVSIHHFPFNIELGFAQFICELNTMYSRKNTSQKLKEPYHVLWSLNNTIYC